MILSRIMYEPKPNNYTMLAFVQKNSHGGKDNTIASDSSTFFSYAYQQHILYWNFGFLLLIISWSIGYRNVWKEFFLAILRILNLWECALKYTQFNIFLSCNVYLFITSAIQKQKIVSMYP